MVQQKNGWKHTSASILLRKFSSCSDQSVWPWQNDAEISVSLPHTGWTGHEQPWRSLGRESGYLMLSGWLVQWINHKFDLAMIVYQWVLNHLESISYHMWPLDGFNPKKWSVTTKSKLHGHICFSNQQPDLFKVTKHCASLGVYLIPG